MLNKYEKKVISEHIYTSDQDYFFYSSLYGEPFLYKNFIFYFDGECLSISGYPLDNKLSIENYILELNELINQCLVNFRDNIKIINYTGILKYHLIASLLDQFEEIYSLLPDNRNVDIYIDLSDPLLLKTSKVKESVRKYKKNRIQIMREKYYFLKHNHVSLLRSLILRDEICFTDTIILLNFITVLHSKEVFFFEAYHNNQCVGFAIIHEYFPKTPFLITICTCTSISNVSDALYISIIDYFLRKGAKKIGLGYSINDGLLYYKTKWGGIHNNLPYYQFIWKRKDLILDSVDIINWMGRLFFRKDF